VRVYGQPRYEHGTCFVSVSIWRPGAILRNGHFRIRCENRNARRIVVACSYTKQAAAQFLFSPIIPHHVEARRIQQMWIYQIVLDFRLKMISEEKDGQKRFGTVFSSRDHAMMRIAAVLSAWFRPPTTRQEQPLGKGPINKLTTSLCRGASLASI
jgi:hypothetical protein